MVFFSFLFNLNLKRYDIFEIKYFDHFTKNDKFF